ncbi:DedA family protein [Armatimonas sp.]|uniref:DedA family protein n=1 Tax=Armatimonas sp. TaxID=1872638 RepID=UPI003752FBC6
MSQLLEILRHFPEWLDKIIAQYGTLTYAILFAIVFVETGVVIFPFLPGDSLLFAVGAVAARPASPLNIALLYPLFLVAAFLGDNCNYWLGKKFGRSLFNNPNSKLFKKENLYKTEAFFAKYGPKAIILARFVPIVRTFMPFVAGMGAMTYGRFLLFSVTGAVLWVGLCVTAGYFFGNISFVKKNFELVLIGIILISVLPMVFEFLQHRKQAALAKAQERR